MLLCLRIFNTIPERPAKNAASRRKSLPPEGMTILFLFIISFWASQLLLERVKDRLSLPLPPLYTGVRANSRSSKGRPEHEDYGGFYLQERKNLIVGRADRLRGPPLGIWASISLAARGECNSREAVSRKRPPPRRPFRLFGTGPGTEASIRAAACTDPPDRT